MNAQEVIDAPRFHHQWLPGVINYEKFGFSPDTIKELQRRGHSMREGGGQGVAQVIVYDPKEDMLEGGTDHRVADGVNVPPSGETMPVAPADVARLGLHIRPRKADLLADDNDLGRTTTRTSPVCLSPGDHVLELRYPGYQTLRIRLDVKGAGVGSSLQAACRQQDG